ncbi:cytochrome b/b6 domain-containing protein [Yunchengibacter salinarum]|uniref:cytochrome b/b6 domain-containing protein n=1 Tax=Yunchengibacter salinarum TaxID=3133399 RepID=UPI0035B6388D
MRSVKVWDGAIRLFHLALIITFSLSAYSAFQDKFGIWADVHLWSGLSVLLLVGWRLVWGLVGSETARFRSFLAAPKHAVGHLITLLRRQQKTYPYAGHNPAGGWMVAVMLALLLWQAGAGLFASDDMFFSGPLASMVSEDLSGTLTGWHELTGFVLFGLIGLHVLAVLVYALWARVPLIRPMITGRRPLPRSVTAPKLVAAPWALLPLALVAALIWWGVLA